VLQAHGAGGVLLGQRHAVDHDQHLRRRTAAQEQAGGASAPAVLHRLEAGLAASSEARSTAWDRSMASRPMTVVWGSASVSSCSERLAVTTVSRSSEAGAEVWAKAGKAAPSAMGQGGQARVGKRRRHVEPD
jgi:hypothetical protein